MDLRRRGRAKKQRVRELESQAINLRQESAIVDYLDCLWSYNALRAVAVSRAVSGWLNRSLCWHITGEVVAKLDTLQVAGFDRVDGEAALDVWPAGLLLRAATRWVGLAVRHHMKPSVGTGAAAISRASVRARFPERAAARELREWAADPAVRTLLAVFLLRRVHESAESLGPFGPDVLRRVVEGRVPALQLIRQHPAVPTQYNLSSVDAKTGAT